MSQHPRVPRLPYVLLGALTLASFGGPLVILLVVRGGASELWPPDRPVEWITIGLVFSLAIALFGACVTLSWWYAPARVKTRPKSSDANLQFSDQRFKPHNFESAP